MNSSKATRKHQAAFSLHEYPSRGTGQTCVRINLSGVRYGRYTYTHATNPALDQRMSPQWVTNLDIAHHFTDSLTVSVGGNKVFDTHPNKLLPANSTPAVGSY